jgi:hypothetical protein
MAWRRTSGRKGSERRTGRSGLRMSFTPIAHTATRRLREWLRLGSLAPAPTANACFLCITTPTLPLHTATWRSQVV